jgi:hypothetical protein
MIIANFEGDSVQFGRDLPTYKGLEYRRGNHSFTHGQRLHISRNRRQISAVMNEVAFQETAVYIARVNDGIVK